MASRANGEDLMWMRLATFAKRSEYILWSGASLADAEEILFGWQLPGDLPVCYACLAVGMADVTEKG